MPGVKAPQVICLRLDSAIESLNRAGYESIKVIVTHPPGRSPGGVMRVIQQRVCEDSQVTLVCSTELVRKGVDSGAHED
jgi:hypothetical protein